MRLDAYEFVLDGWRPDGPGAPGLLRTGYNLAIDNGLPYVQFHAITDQGAASVQCDPCSFDQDRAAYTAMVRADLEKALAKFNATRCSTRAQL